MTQLSIPTLVEQTRELIGAIKRNYLAIAINLYQIHEGWTGTVDEWVAFYGEELELSKSTVSKLLKVGGYMTQHSLSKTTAVGFEKMYLSINRNPDKEPEYVVAEAQSWASSDYSSAKKDECKTPDFHLVCTNCWSSKEKHA